MSTRRVALGHQGEDAAAHWYVAHGYELVARNWRCAQGEIDVLCRRRDASGRRTLVVCEVKARSSHALGHPLEAVTPAKQRRLRRLAALFLSGQDVYYDRIRFDVAAVDRQGLLVHESAF